MAQLIRLQSPASAPLLLRFCQGLFQVSYSEGQLTDTTCSHDASRWPSPLYEKDTGSHHTLPRRHPPCANLRKTLSSSPRKWASLPPAVAQKPYAASGSPAAPHPMQMEAAGFKFQATDDAAWHIGGPAHSQSFLSNLCDARTLDTLMTPARGPYLPRTPPGPGKWSLAHAGTQLASLRLRRRPRLNGHATWPPQPIRQETQRSLCGQLPDSATT